MREEKWKKRDKKIRKKKHGMRVVGKSFEHIINRLRKQGGKK